MELQVQTLTGAKIRILISRSRSTVGDLKSRLFEHWQIPVAGQILAHKGRLLTDRNGAFLSELGVESGDSLVVIFSSSRCSPQKAASRYNTIRYARSQQGPVEAMASNGSRHHEVAMATTYDPAKVFILEEMGFNSLDLIRCALVINRNDIEASVEWLSRQMRYPPYRSSNRPY